VEIRTYRQVSLAVMGRMGEKLARPGWKKALLRMGIHAVYFVERCQARRRMTRLRHPERENALGAAPS